ncbi:hypothetical protein COY32_05115 [candidate division WWE3 bacterium CG_4_10_14_0_2_um_filter_41_14]|uniref:Uncharacterized protein n=1 Tax=candidate division WWE3 bacterium CG_4_10_14_0_2_um_filter_41_14 TaxID=1975072 RepID=A0A2M7TI53_UNCKA|nr:MAG: hypothetical protein COY32_05115 [candidate division WWE3 bacterium CG_4_10_14_0_2_um_filter_41_14]
MNTSKRTIVLILTMLILGGILLYQTFISVKTPTNVNQPLGKGYEISPDLLEQTLEEKGP